MGYILKEKQDDVLILTINNPKALNALNYQVLVDIEEAFKSAIEDNDVKVIVLTGEGKAFVAGADIGAMSIMNAQEGKVFGEYGAKVFRLIESQSKPVIAAVNGFALGGGCELAMACDIRIASEKAKFGQPEVGLGITPGFSGTQRLSRIVGTGKAKELIFTGNIINASEAKEIGLVNKVVAPELLMEETLAMAKKIASNGQIAVKYSKEAIDKGYGVDIDTGIAIEASLFGLCFATEDQKEGMTAFLEKRQSEFKGK